MDEASVKTIKFLQTHLFWYYFKMAHTKLIKIKKEWHRFFLLRDSDKFSAKKWEHTGMVYTATRQCLGKHKLRIIWSYHNTEKLWRMDMEIQFDFFFFFLYLALLRSRKLSKPQCKHTDSLFFDVMLLNYDLFSLKCMN